MFITGLATFGKAEYVPLIRNYWYLNYELY